MRQCLILLSAIILLSGCSYSYVRTNVTRFNSFGNVAPKDALYSFVGSPRSLEEASYRARIAGAFKQLGWNQVSPQRATYYVKYSWAIDKGTVVQSSSPVYGNVGGGVSTISGTVTGPSGLNSTYIGTTVSSGSPGVVGVANESDILYRRDLKISISETVSGREVFEGKAWNSGPSASLPSVMPFLISSLFHEFPGINGAFNLYSVNIDRELKPIGPIKEVR